MLGLRASSQDMRRKFFQIYNKTIPAPLFDRLQFLICTQSWEKLAGTFWLKEALVRSDRVGATYMQDLLVEIQHHECLDMVPS